MKKEKNKRTEDLYPPNNNTSNEGNTLPEVDEEKTDTKLLGKKRKLTKITNPSQENDINQKKSHSSSPERVDSSQNINVNSVNQPPPQEQDNNHPLQNLFNSFIRIDHLINYMNNFINELTIRTHSLRLRRLEIINQIIEEIRGLASAEASTEASSDSGDEEENRPINEDQN